MSGSGEGCAEIIVRGIVVRVLGVALNVQFWVIPGGLKFVPEERK